MSDKYPPGPDALQWVAEAVGPGTTIRSVHPMAGATSSALHSVDAARNGRMMKLVLRRFVNQEWLKEEPDLALHEAASLEKANVADVPTPELVAYDEMGEHCGVPAVLMTRLPGSVELKPQNIDERLRRLAEAIIPVHAVEVGTHPWGYSPYVDVARLGPPDWSSIPELWERAIGILAGPRPPARESFIHRDYHPANVVWLDNRVSGVVDWPNACRGPAGVDLGWCRRNLVQLHGLPEADRFLDAYRSVAGATSEHHPYWDLITLVEVLGWAKFGRDVMRRLDEYLASVMARL